jgi:hypothetical protein
MDPTTDLASFIRFCGHTTVRSNASIVAIVERIVFNPFPTIFDIALLTLLSPIDKIAQQGLGINCAGLLRGIAITIARIKPTASIF